MKRHILFTIFITLILINCSTYIFSQQLRVNTMPSWSTNPEEGNAVVGQPLIVWGSAFGGTPPYSFSLSVDFVAAPNNDPYPITNSACYAYDHYAGNSCTFTTCGVHLVQLKVVDAAGVSDSSVSKVYAWTNPSDSIKIDMLVDKGLLYLYKNAFNDVVGTDNDAYWFASLAGYWDKMVSTATTSAATLAFEEKNHFGKNNFLTDPYAELISKSLNWILSKYSGTLAISNHDDGTGITQVSDVNGNGIGAFIYGTYDSWDHPVYVNSFGLLAVIMSQNNAAQASINIINAGPFTGWSYANFVKECLETLYWDQGDGVYRGGWHYEVSQPQQNDGYDGSTQQWPCLVMKAAEDRWGIAAPQWVKDNTLVGYAAITDNGSCRYNNASPFYQNIGKTGGMLSGYAWMNKLFNAADPDAALTVAYVGQIYNNWSDGMNPNGGWAGNFYHMYSLKKGLKLQGIDTIVTPSGTVNWYHDMVAWLSGEQIYTLPTGFTTTGKSAGNCYGQNPDGSWIDGTWITNYNLGTAHALLILTPYLFNTAPEPPTPEFQICFGDTVQLSAGINSPNYSWHPAANISDPHIPNPFVFPQITTDYFLTFDTLGCAAVKDYLVKVNPAINTSISGTNVLCYGNSTGAVDFTITGGTPGYTYLWNDSSTTQDLVNIPSGTYSVTVMDSNNCSKSATITITQPAAPLTVSLTGTDVLCFGDSTGAVDLSVSGGTQNYTYIWSNDSTSQDLINITANTYSVTVTDANNCIATASITIIQPAAPLATTISGINVLCTGNSSGAVDLTVTGGTTAYSYHWSNNTSTEDLINITANTYDVTVTDANSCTITTGITITQPPDSLADTLTSINVLCYGNSSGSIGLIATGGVAGYSFNWSNGDTTQNLINIPADTYIVTVTDANNCIITSSVIITQPNGPLTVSLTKANVSCFGYSDGAIDLTVFGGTTSYSYDWSTGATLEDLVNLPPGFYSVTVTDANSCTETDSISIAQPDILSMTFSFSDALCFNSCDGQAEAIVTGGTTPYHYTWLPVGTGVNIDSLYTLCAGSYSLTVKDYNLCQIDTSFTINQPDIISYSYSTVDILCFNGLNGEIHINNIGGTSPYTYNWSPTVSTDTVAANISAGTYEITITDSHQCDTAFSVTITQPPLLVLSTSGNDTVCIGESYTISSSATGGVSPYVFTWDNNLGNIDSTTLTGQHTTTYSVFVTDTNNCVTSSQSLEVFVYPVVHVTAHYAGDSAICLNDTTMITAIATGGNGGPYTYTWSENIGVHTPPVQVSPTHTTTYYVTASDNCGSPVAIGSIIVIVNPLPVVNFTGINKSGCQPLKVDFTDLSYPDIASWQWHFGDPLSGSNNTSNQQNPSHTYLNPGTYHVTLTTTTIYGCIGTTTLTNFVNVYPLPIADFTFHPPFADIENPVIYFINHSTGDSIRNWNFGDPASGNMNTSYVYSPIHEYNTPGTYTVLLVVSSNKGCIDSTSKTLIYRPEYTFYVPEAFSPNGDGLNDSFGPKGIGVDLNDYQMFIFDRWGEIIFETTDVNKSWDGNITGTNEFQPVGVYVWLILYRKTSDYDKHLYRLVGRVTLLR